MRKFFELTKPYRFEVGDVTAFIYTICVIFAFCGIDNSILFLIGSAIGTAFCWQAHRINLVVLNVALFVFNLYCVFGG